MLNAPVQMVPQQYPYPVQNTSQQLKVVPEQKTPPAQSMYNEQSMAISYDIAAEYSAIGKINNIIADVVKELKTEEDPVRIKLLEARVNTLNNMVLQRENRLNQMEQSLNTVNQCYKN